MTTTKLSRDTETMSDNVREINAILLAHPELHEDALVIITALYAKQKEEQGEKYELPENARRFMHIFRNVPEELKKILKENELWGPYIRAINFVEYQTEKERLIEECKDLPAQEFAEKLAELAKKYNL